MWEFRAQHESPNLGNLSLLTAHPTDMEGSSGAGVERLEAMRADLSFITAAWQSPGMLFVSFEGDFIRQCTNYSTALNLAANMKQVD